MAIGKVLKIVAIVAVAAAIAYFAPQISAALLVSASAATTAAVTAAVAATLSLAASVGFSLLAGKPSAGAATPSIFRQAISNSFIVYGLRRVGGLLIFFHPVGKEYRYFVIAVAGHRCKGVVRWYLGDDEVTVDATGRVISGTYANNAWLWFYRGTDDQVAHPLFVAETQGKWTSNHPARGTALIYAKFKMTDEVVQAGMPNITAEVEGKDDILDPRTDERGYTRNASLVFYDWMALPREEGGFGCYPDEIDWDWVAAQANVCDEDIPLAAGGTEKRYELDCYLQTGAAPSEVRETLVTCCAGSFTYSGGKMLMRPGYYIPPSATLLESDLSGAITVPGFLPGDEAANEVSGTYIDPTNLYQPKDVPTRSIYANDVRQMTVDLPHITSGTRGQRILEYRLRKAQAERRVTWPMNIVGIGISTLDSVQLATARYGLSNYTFQVISWGLSQDFSVNLGLEEHSPELFEWNISMELAPGLTGQLVPAEKINDAGAPNVPATAGDGVADDRVPLLTSLGAGGSVQVEAGTYYLSDITRPTRSNLVLRVDPAAAFTGPGEIDLKNSLPNIPSPVWSPDLYSKTYGPEWNGIKNVFQVASYANAAVVRGGSAVGPAIVALFGHGQTSVEGSAAWGLNVVGYANAANSVAIANETDSGALVSGGKAYNTVLVSTGFFPSVNALQIQSNKAGGSFIDGIMFNNRQVTSVSGTGEPIVTDVPAVTGTLIAADEGGSERFVRTRMVHTISEWESQNFVIGPSYVPVTGAGRRYARVDATSGGVYIRARDDGSNATNLYLGSVGTGGVQFLTGRGGTGEVVQMEIRHATGATDHLTVTGGTGDVEIGTAGSSTTSSISIRGRGANGGVKVRDGNGAIRMQATPSGVGFNGTDPSIPQIAANLPTDGSATNSSIVTAINSHAAALRGLGLAT